MTDDSAFGNTVLNTGWLGALPLIEKARITFLKVIPGDIIPTIDLALTGEEQEYLRRELGKFRRT